MDGIDIVEMGTSSEGYGGGGNELCSNRAGMEKMSAGMDGDRYEISYPWQTLVFTAVQRAMTEDHVNCANYFRLSVQKRPNGHNCIVLCWHWILGVVLQQAVRRYQTKISTCCIFHRLVLPQVYFAE